MEKIAFIGMGNMAQALTGGFIKSGKIEPKNIFAYAPNQQKLAQNAAKYGFIPCASLKEAVSKADTIFQFLLHQSFSAASLSTGFFQALFFLFNITIKRVQ